MTKISNSLFILTLTYLTLHRKQQIFSLRCLQNHFSLTLWCQYLFLRVMILKHQQQHWKLWHGANTISSHSTIEQESILLGQDSLSACHCSLSLRQGSQCFSSICSSSPPLMNSFLCSIPSGIFCQAEQRDQYISERTSMFEARQESLGKNYRKRCSNTSQRMAYVTGKGRWKLIKKIDLKNKHRNKQNNCNLLELWEDFH